jgi:serine/threonine protein kinase/tetratricopeptide (TPR) repeat protein
MLLLFFSGIAHFSFALNDMLIPSRNPMDTRRQIGNYQILRPLGEGGYAKVYLGLHVYLSTPVAIKILHTGLSSADQQQFLAEARMIASLDHLHIVRVLDFGVEDNISYLIMDYAPMGSVRTQYPQGLCLEPSIVVSFVSQIAEALQYAHDQNLVHRDVKPDNILLKRSNHVVLSDFGIAMVMHHAPFPNRRWAGTVDYSAPEQLEGRSSPASDQYALGITAYEWLTGERPFQGTNFEIEYQHLHTPAPPLREKQLAIPASVEEVVLRTLAKNAEERWPSVLAFADALALALSPGSESSIGAKSSSPSKLADAEAQSAIWHVPHPRNPYFTGRNDVLEQLHASFQSIEITALTQSHALCGLGGVGKTQVAIEYAYRYRETYQWIFWIRSETQENLLTDISAIASVLVLPEKDEQDTNRLVTAVKQWLHHHNNWLLIFDNIEDVALLSTVLPSPVTGHVLLTSRSHVIASLAHSIDLEEMIPEEATVFLLRRAKRIGMDVPYGAIPPLLRQEAKGIAEMLDAFPLALDQAGAYLEETGCTLSDYLDAYRTSRAALLQRRGDLQTTGHPESVATTLSLSIERIAQRNVFAADLLRGCAFLSPEYIPEELMREIADGLHLKPSFARSNVAVWDEALHELQNYSLLHRDPETHTLSIHRLVQAVLRESMDIQEQKQWAERVIRAVNHVFPNGGDIAQWNKCQRFLAQVHVCEALISEFSLTFPEAARLLHQLGIYLMEHAQYPRAAVTLREALGIRSLLCGQSSEVQEHDIAETLNDLGLMYMIQQDYANAESSMLRALELFEKVHSIESSDVAIVTNNLASVAQRQGKYAEAEVLLLKALFIWQELQVSCSPDVARTTNNLALLYAKQQRFAEAEPLYQQALTLWERLSGPEHPDVARTLNNLAKLYREQGKYSEAEPLLLRSRAIREKTLGPDHPEAAKPVHDLAVLYTLQTRYAEAEPLFQLALEIREQMLGVNHPSTAETLRGYADMLRQVGRTAEADALLQRAEAIHPSI